MHVGSLGGGCVYISICSKDRKYARGLGKHMRKGTRRHAKCRAPTASAVLSVALFSDSTTVGKAIVGPHFSVRTVCSGGTTTRALFAKDGMASLVCANVSSSNLSGGKKWLGIQFSAV